MRVTPYPSGTATPRPTRNQLGMKSTCENDPRSERNLNESHVPAISHQSDSEALWLQSNSHTALPPHANPPPVGPQGLSAHLLNDPGMVHPPNRSKTNTSSAALAVVSAIRPAGAPNIRHRLQIWMGARTAKPAITQRLHKPRRETPCRIPASHHSRVAHSTQHHRDNTAIHENRPATNLTLDVTETKYTTAHQTIWFSNTRQSDLQRQQIRNSLSI